MPCWCQKWMGRLVRDDRKATFTQITTRYNQGLQTTISERTAHCSNPEADGLQQQKTTPGPFTSHVFMSIPLWLQCIHLLMYFQQDNAPCHKAQIISDWFLEQDNELTLLKWPPQSPDLNPIEHIWDVDEREIRIMDVQPTNLQQLRDAIMSIWTKISEECFQNLVESMSRIIKPVLKAKGGPTRY